MSEDTKDPGPPIGDRQFSATQTGSNRWAPFHHKASPRLMTKARPLPSTSSGCRQEWISEAVQAADVRVTWPSSRSSMRSA